MNRCSGFSLLLLLVLFQFSFVQSAVSPNEAFSAGRKFSVDVSQTQLDKVLISVFQWNGENKALFWAKNIQPDENGNFNSYGIRKVVSDDGKIVILRTSSRFDSQPPMRILRQKGNEIEISREQFREAAGLELDDEFSGGSDLSEQTFDLFLEHDDPPFYCVWFASTNWAVVNLSNFTVSTADTKLRARLESLGLTRARDLVRQHQPGALARLLAPMRRTAAEHLPAFQQFAGGERLSLNDEVAGAYRFLAMMRKSEDKASLQNLLKEQLTHFGASFGPTALDFVYSAERALADELLAAWEGKTNPEQEDTPGSDWEKKRYYLASISGTVRLPFASQDKEGAVKVYLIPNSIAEGAWDSSEEIVALASHPGMPGMRMPGMTAGEEEAVSQIHFAFGTLSPGEYRLKAVWDHRPPYAKSGEEKAAKPQPGDYESAETKPFKLAAGDVNKGVSLYCTNRVGPAEKFFADDELWKAKHPPDYSEPEDESASIFGRMREKTLFTAPITNWIVKTNKLKESIRLTKIRWIESNDYSGERSKKVGLTFVDKSRKKDDYNSQFEGVLTDEHGCKFHTAESTSSDRWTELHFNPFPYQAKILKFELKETRFSTDARPGAEPKPELVASFTITNLISVVPENLKAAPVPSRHELDIVAIELLSAAKDSDLGDEEDRRFPINTSFRFFQKGAETHAWRTELLKYLDRWGNSSMNGTGFCRQEKALKVQGRFVRDFELGEFSEEERWEIPIEKIPGPGETKMLKLKKEMQGAAFELIAIGGTGEFTYRNGDLISATNQITQFSNPRSPFPTGFPRSADGRSREPKVYLKNDAPYQHYMIGPGARRGPDQVVARVPHIVYKVSRVDPKTQYELLDEMQEAEPRERHDFYPSPWRNQRSTKYVASKYRPGERNRTLTFIAQKPRETEFVIEVP
jgi:hypothetical protein